MTQGNNATLPRKVCTKRAAHGPHSWWSRQHKRYFQCGGHHGKPPMKARVKQ